MERNDGPTVATASDVVACRASQPLHEGKPGSAPPYPAQHHHRRVPALPVHWLDVAVGIRVSPPLHREGQGRRHPSLSFHRALRRRTLTAVAELRIAEPGYRWVPLERGVHAGLVPYCHEARWATNETGTTGLHDRAPRVCEDSRGVARQVQERA